MEQKTEGALDIIQHSARNGRTAFLVGCGLALLVGLTGSDTNLALYGHAYTGLQIGTDAGRTLFLGMGLTQATLFGFAVCIGSLALRLGIMVVRTLVTLIQRAHARREAAHG